jgi:16S rRNA (uracil1498-N3)-methyltransferase
MQQSDIQGKPLFYYPFSLQGEIALAEEESRHCVLSLRFKEGQEMYLTDGKGTLAKAKLVKANPKSANLNVLKNEIFPPARVFRRLVVSPPKTGERLDWLVEKAVEIGVDEIVCIETRRAERDKINLERLEKIAISAMKQSKQVYLPTIRGMVKWKQFLTETYEGAKYIAAVQTDVNRRQLSVISCQSSVVSPPSSFTILIGPEGDFTDEEVTEAVNNGYVRVSLGQNILRTETAAIYSLVCFNSIGM